MPYKDKKTYAEYYRENRERILLRNKKWQEKNRERRRKYAKELKLRNLGYRNRCILALRKRRLESPWLGHFDAARTRCTNKKRKEYPRYGGRGIKFLLTHGDVEILWHRDNASNMVRPTIDRIDNDGHYELGNCRFIEKSVNSTKGNYEARWLS